MDKPRPTLFEGTLYRSRLEANFAKFLVEQQRNLDFTFEYQPERLGSEEYQPDFSIHQNSEETLIEVKPIIFADETWLAIRAAQETKKRLLVVDSSLRDTWGVFVVVSKEGKLRFFTDFEPGMLQFSLSPFPCGQSWGFWQVEWEVKQ